MGKTNSNGKRSGQTSHRAASYIRISSHKQETSPEQQRREIIELAKRKGYEIVERYIDEGISGDEIEKRPDFLRMLKDGQAGKFDVILCWDQDRFGRFDSLKAGYVIEPLRMRGVPESEIVHEAKTPKIHVQGDAVMVDDAKVIKTGIEASNGVMHVIDTVVLPK